jgi:hypothetical protein
MLDIDHASVSIQSGSVELEVVEIAVADHAGMHGGAEPNGLVDGVLGLDVLDEGAVGVDLNI